MTDCVPGIIIEDVENGSISVQLPSILEEIEKGDSYHWSILSIWALGDIGDFTIYGFHQQDFEEEIRNTKDGFHMSWEQLNLFSSKPYQIVDTIILGSKDASFLKRYENEEMYKNCDIVIEMFDGQFWKVFSKENKLIDRFANKFNKITLIDSNDTEWITMS